MKILVTGGAGYVGTELARKLAYDDSVEEVVIYDNLSRKNYNLFLNHKLPGEKVRFIRGELLDSRRLRKAISSVDIVYHLAAKVTTPFASQDPHFFEQINHWGTAELVYAIEEIENLDKFIYLSSTSVYGASSTEADEFTLPQPKTYYGISKLRGEEHVRRLFEKMNAIIIRLGNVYGYSPSMRFDAVINKFMMEANFSNLITLQGSGKQPRAFIHVDKATDALAEIAHKKIPEGVYNLVDKNLTIEEIADTLREIFPTLETLHVNQHMELRELRVSPAGMINQYFKLKPSSLKEELQEFKDHFAFHPTF